MTTIQLSDVSWIRNQKLILSDINWTVKKGEHWAIIGLNGSGKTSILNLITGYTWPTKGTVEVLGHRFGKVDLREVRKQIGWVSASMADRITTDKPLERALDVVISGKYASVGLWENDAHDEDIAYQLLVEMNSEHLADKPLQVLSQGEKQRVLIARAMMSKLDLLILDEPCTGLDVRARETLLQAIDRLAHGQTSHVPTLLYVTHHSEEILPCFTHVLLLKNGRISASGPKHEVMTSEHLSDAFEIDVDLSWRGDRPWIQVESWTQTPSTS